MQEKMQEIDVVELARIDGGWYIIVFAAVAAVAYESCNPRGTIGDARGNSYK